MKGGLLTSMLIASGLSKPRSFNDGLKRGKYPFSEEELEKLESFTNIKEKKKYIKQLQAKYRGQAKE